MKTLKFNKNAGLITVLTAALFGCLSYIIRFYNNNAHYEVQDWLINYQGGFVRRGIPGELFYQLYNFTGIHPGWMVFIFVSIHFQIFVVSKKRTTTRQWPR